MKSRKFIIVLILVSICCTILAVTACTNIETTHKHTYATEWSYDEYYHWHKATCEHTDEISDKSAHNFVNDVCTICNWSKNQSINPDSQYKVTYNANGGKFSDFQGTYSVNVDAGSLLSKIENPIREGYTFQGWYKNSSLIEEWNFNSDIVTSTITLYASWEKIIRVEYDVTFVLNYDGARNVTYSTQDGLVTYIPTREGYVFNGWWLSDGQTADGYILSERYDTSRIVETAGLTLYAEWVEESTVSSQLAAPSVSISENVFSWSKINNAQSYRIIVYKSGSNDSLSDEVITTTSWTFPNGYDEGYYNVKIRANGDGLNTVNSSYVTKSYANRILPTVSNIQFDISTSILTWNSVRNATQYALYINNVLVEELTYTTYDMSAYNAGIYNIKIVASRDSYVSSSASSQVEKLRLRTPIVNLRVDKDELSYVFTWESVYLADTYIIKFNETEVRTNECRYEIKNDDAIWGALNQAIISINAYDSKADYLVSINAFEYSIGKLYSVTLETNIDSIGEVTITGDLKYAPQKYTVTFDLNGGSGSISPQVITSTTGLIYPTIPTRSGYAFRGWYLDKFCNTIFDFSAEVVGDITVYAGWSAMVTNYYSCNYIDVTSNYKSSSNAYSFSTSGTSSSAYRYTYFTALISGTYNVYYRNSSSSSTYGAYIYIYNATQGSTIRSNINVYSTSYTNISFSANAGDIIYIRNYRYNTSYSSTFYFYITGGDKPTAGGKCNDKYYMEDNDASNSNSIITNAGSNLAIEIKPYYDSYIFLGWFDGETLITKELDYSFIMPSKNMTYTARWKYYSVTTSKNIDEAGTIIELNDQATKVGDQVTITATTNTGYTWVGWYNGDTQITKELSYTFNMPLENVTYTAKWSKVTLERNDTSAGSISSLTSKYKVGDEVTVTATSNSGYTFLGWYNGDIQLTNEFSYTFNMQAESVTYTAKWTYYTLTTARDNTSAGSVTTKNAVKTTADQEVTITATTNSGYTFLGWYNGETLLSTNASYTFNMPSENVTYTAKWTYYTLTTARNDTSAGTVTTKNAVKTTAGQSVTITATTNSGYTFLGWYNGDTLLSTNASYTFNMPAETVTYTAHWTYYTLTTDRNDTSAGSVTVKDAVKTTAGQSVTIVATTNFGYTFDGWYKGETLLSTNESYTFNMPAESVTYTAKWVYYTVSVEGMEGGDVSLAPIISFNLNGGSGSIDSQIITATQGLVYPDIPTREGYVFRGWFEDANCTTIYDFSKKVTESKTLYAGWQVMATSYSSRNIIDIASKYNSSSNVYSISTINTSSSSPYYTYFTALTSGTYEIYYANGSSNVTVYSTYVYIYNVTQGSVIRNNSSYASKSYTSISVTANAGDVIYIRNYRYDTNYSSTFYLYVTGGKYPTDGGKSDINDVKSSKVTVGEKLTVTATTDNGYTFIGWYDGETELSKKLEYTFAMPANNLTLTAKWITRPVTITKDIPNAGIVTGLPNTSVVGQEYTVNAITYNGYTWLGWYNGETKLTDNFSYTFVMPSESLALTAKWISCPVTIAVNDSEAGSVNSLPQTTKVGQEYTIIATTNTGYTWLGWYNGETQLTNELSYTFTMSSTNVTYTAKWIKVNLARNDTSAGSISALTGNYKVGDEVTVTATTNSGYTWLGWYNDDTLLCTNASYTFDMPSENVTYTAKWTYYTLTVNATEGGTVNDALSQVVVSFNLNGATGSEPTSQTLTKNNALQYPSIPTRSGYVFAGWYDNSACSGSPFDFTATVMGDVTLYAKWISYDGTGVLNLNESKSISVVSKSSSKSYYAFVPLTNGSVTIYTTGSLDTYGYLYNSSKSELTTDDDSGDGNNFKITYTVTAGTLYYVSPCGYSSSGTTTVYLTADLPQAGGKLSGFDELDFAEPQKITVGETIVLKAKTLAGYTFVGWYNGETKLSSELTYTFSMLADNLTYTAKWSKVTLELNVLQAGTVTSLDSTYKYGDSVTIIATTNLGYTFDGWYNGEMKLASELSYTFNMPDQNVTYTAKWNINTDMLLFTFTSTETTLIITGIKNKSVTNIIVPDYVTSISKSAFSGCSKLTSITLPFVGATKDGTSNTHFGYIFGASGTSYNSSYVPSMLKEVIITGGSSIGSSAFYNCSSLTSIEIPSSVTSIGNGAFDGCSSLTSIEIPSSVTSIGSYAFGCSSLTIYCELSSKPSGWDSSWNCGYWNSRYNYRPVVWNCKEYGVTENGIKWGLTKDEIMIIAGYGGESTEVVIPEVINGYSATDIGSYAFSGCSSLTSIEIPSSVTSIGSYAFSYCSSLTSIEIPSSVETIGQYAFSGCTSLTIYCEVESRPSGWDSYFNSNTGTVGSSSVPVVWNCVGHTVTEGGIIVGLTNDGLATVVKQSPTINGGIVIPSQITYKGKIYSITEIEASAFEDCSLVTSISLPSSVTTIGSKAFYNCSKLTSIAISSGVTTIGYYAFYGCSNLTSMTVDENNIRYKSEGNCVIEKDTNTLVLGCKNSVIPNYITTIGAYAFSGCSGLTSIGIPDSVTNIYVEAFIDCTSLKSVTFGENSKLTSIGRDAFRGCSGIVSIKIPNSVTQIIDGAFAHCYGLTSVTFGESSKLASIGGNAFYYCTSLTNIVIPSGVTAIGYYAFAHCSKLTSIVIPINVKSIEYHAFDDCTSLKSVMFENSSGWYYTSSSTSSSGTSIDVTNASTNATNLTSTYSSYYWKRKA